MRETCAGHDGVDAEPSDPRSRNMCKAISTIRLRFSAAFSRLTCIDLVSFFAYRPPLTVYMTLVMFN